MPSNAAARLVEVSEKAPAMVCVFKTTVPLVAALITISSAMVAASAPVMVSVDVNVVMPSNAAARLAEVSLYA